MKKIDTPTLTPDQKKAINEIAALAKKTIQENATPTGKNISSTKSWQVLFTGTDGTAKTMAAEMLAKELGSDVYRVDLNKVISKYIGETEKNLNKLFVTAQDKNYVLFFDEADALFGKRTDVKDSHDRYANIEVNYLLQKMEDHKGLSILAAKTKASIDPAFIRRIQTMIKF